MKRIVEPELMDASEQVQAYADANFADTDDALVALFLARFGQELRGPIVDLGCGPGNIAIRLAQALPTIDVIGVDGAARMLEVARKRGARYSNLSFLHAILPSQAVEGLGADAVVSNSLLHHLHEPSVFWDAVRAIGTPGAAVLVGDLRRPHDAAEVESLVSQYAAEAPDALRDDFRASLQAAFEVPEIEAQLEDASLASFSVEAVGDRHVIIGGRLPLA